MRYKRPLASGLWKFSFLFICVHKAANNFFESVHIDPSMPAFIFLFKLTLPDFVFVPVTTARTPPSTSRRSASRRTTTSPWRPPASGTQSGTWRIRRARHTRANVRNSSWFFGQDFLFCFSFFFLNGTQRTRLRRFCAKWNCVIVQIYLVKKPCNGRKIIAKPSQRRFFAPNLGLFFNISIIRRNFDVKPSQRRYFTSILRKKNT